MGTGAEAPAWAASRALRAVAMVLGLGCGEATLDGPASTSTGDTLPPLESGEATSTGDGSTGEPVIPDDPRWCAVECAIVLPVDWAYEGAPEWEPAEPDDHVVPAMLREPDGALLVAELRDGKARLHRLRDDGEPQWDVALPLPCDPCELSDVARHPSGDLLVSASGLVVNDLRLLAARYDAVRHELVWLASHPLESFEEGVHVRSGGITALSDELVAQLYMRASPEILFDPQQRTMVITYGPDGVQLDDEELLSDWITSARPPLLARTAPDGTLLVGIFYGAYDGFRGLTARLEPPLWQLSYAIGPAAFDDIVLDARGHAIELGHALDGTRVHLLLDERAGVESSPRWSATLALASTTASPGALALGPDGDVYVAIRTTQAPGGTPEPLVGLSLSRWTSQGELRWSTTLLQAVAESSAPLELAVDGDEGLVVAAIVDGRLRVERRAQQCGCEG